MASPIILTWNLLQYNDNHKTGNIDIPAESLKSREDFDKFIYDNIVSLIINCYQCGKNTKKYQSYAINYKCPVAPGLSETKTCSITAYILSCCTENSCIDKNVQKFNILRKSSVRISHRTCNGCGEVNHPDKPKFRVCGRCKWSYYCSEECQRQNWSIHKYNCKKVI